MDIHDLKSHQLRFKFSLEDTETGTTLDADLVACKGQLKDQANATQRPWQDILVGPLAHCMQTVLGHLDNDMRLTAPANELEAEHNERNEQE